MSNRKTFQVTRFEQFEVTVPESELDGWFGDEWREWDADFWSKIANETEGIGWQLWSHVQDKIDNDAMAAGGACTDAYIDLVVDQSRADRPIEIDSL